MPQPFSSDLIDRSIQQAAIWQRLATADLSRPEKNIQKKLCRLIEDPMGKVVFVSLIDQCFRSFNQDRIADQVHYLLERYGLPSFFSLSERFLLRLFIGIGYRMPAISIPRMMTKIRADAGRMVIDGDSRRLAEYLAGGKHAGHHININHLGEAVLGEREAERRLKAYLKDIENPGINYISIKISTIFSQIQPLAFDHGLHIIAERLATLYRHAMRNTYLNAAGTHAPKMVNLDMEAYDDLHLTIAAFQHTMDLPEFKSFTAGIVLQAYLPESYMLQRRLTQWAIDRLASGGAPIKIRIVKGANLEMEQITAAISGWPLAPFDNKMDVDANYKRMVLYGLQPEHTAAVKLGIASHNLFELAFAHIVAMKNGVEKDIVFEMLEGMANHVRRILIGQGLPVLAYTPVASQREFINAIAYLIRRLDENTGPDNFIGNAALIAPDSNQWARLEHGFLSAFLRIDRLPIESHRTQNRLTASAAGNRIDLTAEPFCNEPNTDWTIESNRQWAEAIKKNWCRSTDAATIDIPLVIGGQMVRRSRDIMYIVDLNQLPERICVARCGLAELTDIRKSVSTAKADPDQWRGRSHQERCDLLLRVAEEIAKARANLIGAAAAGVGKLFGESDVEVSEAIDLSRYYAISMMDLTRQTRLNFHGKGTVVVASPWNFPIAIPCGGIAAALITGNTVIFKPASEALLPAWELCKCFWAAGISQRNLQFLPCNGGQMGHHLVGDPDVDAVILTGGTATALQILALRPDLFIAAETGGKNATIVTATADRDQAVKNVIHSAFGHSGQKCSATSLLILEKELYDDAHFKSVLVDAAASLPVGSAWNFSNRMGPLIHPPTGVLARAITDPEQGETWALKPKQIGDNPNLWTPGIKYGVQPGSFTHTTELFGPVLGVMRAKDLRHAVSLANATGYGLTAGLESLDDREIAVWKDTIQAGNLYINRSTTGAVTLRQPFGGMKKSAIGPGIKTGGPNYVCQFVQAVETKPPAIDIIREEHWLLSLARKWLKGNGLQVSDPAADQLTRSAWAIMSYLSWACKEFHPTHDRFLLRGEDNQHRYLPVGQVGICIHPHDSVFEVAARTAAATVCGCPIRLYCPKDLDNDVTAFIKGVEGRRLLQHCQVHYLGRMDHAANAIMTMDRLRYAAPDRVPQLVYAAAAPEGRYIAAAPVLMEGRLELLHYLINQSISHAYHRYGNLGVRAIKRGYRPVRSSA